MERFQSLFFVLVFFLINGLCCHSQKKPELALDKEGIKVYLIKSDTSAFKEYRAVMTVNADIDTIMKQLIDVNSLQKWNTKNRHSSLLKKLSDTSWIFHMTHHLGWPIQNRDNVSRVTLTKKKDEQMLTIHPENNFLAKKEGYLRLKNFKGFWYMKKLPNNQTLVVQQVYGDPGGSVAPFMVNMVVARGPFDTFKALRERVQNLNKK